MIHDPGRLAAVGRLIPIDGASRVVLDRLARAAARAVGAPAAIVALVEADRLRVCGRAGIPETILPDEYPIGAALCPEVVRRRRPYTLEDARELPGDRPAVQTGIVSYAGVPLTIGGHTVGALCVGDVRPRRWSEAEIALLEDLAVGVTAELERSAELGERGRAERALRESEAYHREFLAGLPIGVYRASPEGRFIDVNAALVEILGYPDRDALLREPIDRFAIDSERRAYWQAVLDRDGVIRDVEGWLRRYDGRRIWVRNSARIVRDAAGRMLSYDGTLEDLTERKRAEVERVAAETHYRRLVQTSPYGIFALDLEGRFTEVNAAAARILQRDPDAVQGVSSTEFVSPEDQRRAIEAFQGLARGVDTGVEIGLTVLRPGGERRELEIRAAVIREGEALLGLHGVARDVTEERQREAQLRRAERLASLGTLLSGVAHELNNPLTAIKSFAQLLLLDAHPPQEREALEIMHREADRAAKIVADLRLVARDASEPHDRHAVDLNDVVRYVLRLREYTLRTLNVETRLELAPDLPPVWGDRRQLEQVLLNLVVNAEQALAGAALRRLLLCTRADGRGVAVEVADSGPGIPHAQQEQLFDPFFTTKPPGEGVGLGLSIAHGIATDHGGEIRVRSTPGEGAAFVLELPRAPREGASRVPRSEAPAGGGLRVLVVDDEAPIRSALVRYLSRRGHRVEEAGDGAEALALLGRGRSYDVVLSDLRMPGLGGEVIAAELQRRGRGERLVLMTGAAASEYASFPGGAEVVTKPFELETVARLLERVARE